MTDVYWDHFIGGEVVPSDSGVYLTETSPIDGKDTFHIARGSSSDIARAVEAAAAAGAAWRDKRPMERGRILYKIAEIIRTHRNRLVEIDRTETGRPLWMVRADIDGAAQYFEFYAGLVNACQGRSIDLGAGYHSYTMHEPYGVVGIIVPWNAPLNQAARSAAPALAAGNSVVIKPSEFTSVSVLAFARFATEEGELAPGLLNVVTGTGAEAGAALTGHPLVRKISFTGSVRVGREIGRTAGGRIIPVSLELGGKSPSIVFADADIERAVNGVVNGITVNSGQACSAGSRCLVERSIHDHFVEKLRHAMGAITIGPEEDARMGPIITAAQYEKVQHYLQLAGEEGAQIFTATHHLPQNSDAPNRFVGPSILTRVHNSMRIAQEEIFGPVLVVIPFDDEDEAVRIANDTDYGLAAGLWTADLARALNVARQLEAGQVFVNEWWAGGVETPFGGYKNSGLGREKGIEAIHHYTQTKCVTINLARAPQK